MSVRILLVLEDPTYDRYIVRPIVTKIVSDLGKANARVDVLTDPRLGGVTEVLKVGNWDSILKKYPMIDVFVAVVDRDCAAGRDRQLARLATRVRAGGKAWAGVLAIEEVEVWLMAGYVRDLGARWSAVRKHCHPKEAFFDRFLRAKGARGVGGGRLALMQTALRNLSSLKKRCAEIRDLRNQLCTTLREN